MYRKLVHHCIALFDMSLKCTYWGSMPIWLSLYHYCYVLGPTSIHCMIWCICHYIVTMSITLEIVWFPLYYWYVIGANAHLIVLLHWCIGTVLFENHVKCLGRGLKVPPISIIVLHIHTVLLKCIQQWPTGTRELSGVWLGWVPVLPNMVLKAIELYRNKIQ